jgi:hypothetical protein
MKTIFDFDENDGQTFLNEKPAKGNNSLYKADFNKLKTGKNAYKSKLRFLPNILKEPVETADGLKVKGEDVIEKVRHYVDIKSIKHLCGYYDSPSNFGKDENCPLSQLYFTVTKAETPNAVAIERVENLKYQRKYYSYVMVVEDEQQPELVGKIMILEYGVDIHKKIMMEKKGEKTGETVNVFSMTKGKDFVFYVTQKKTKDNRVYPDYSECEFESKLTSMPIFTNNEVKRLPVEDNGKINPKYSDKTKEFFLTREKELSDYAPKRLTEDQYTKISEITDWVTGKVSMPSGNNASKDDFSTDLASTSTSSKDDDEFFASSKESATSSASTKKDDDDDFFKD